MDVDTLATLIVALVFGIPFIAMIVYAVVLYKRNKKLGVTYDTPKVIIAPSMEDDDKFWKRINDCDPTFPGSIFNYADNDPQNPEYKYR